VVHSGGFGDVFRPDEDAASGAPQEQFLGFVLQVIEQGDSRWISMH
jgi:hypothetical protein